MPFDPDLDNTQQRIIDFLNDLNEAMKDLLEKPPSGMQGEYIEDQQDAWERASHVLDEVRAAVMHAVPGVQKAFESAGLAHETGRSKFRLWNDARRAFLRLRSTRRASRLCHIGAAIVGSLADVLHLGESLKESMEAVKYIAELALSEGNG